MGRYYLLIVDKRILRAALERGAASRFRAVFACKVWGGYTICLRLALW